MRRARATARARHCGRRREAAGLRLPIAAGVLLLLAGDRNAALARWIALGASVLTFVVSLLLWRDFDPASGTMQFVEQQPWIGAFNAWYTLGVDGISMPLTFTAVIFCGGRVCDASGRWPHGNGPETSRSTVLACVGFAPVPASITRYCTPLGSVFTPLLALFWARKLSLFVLFSAEALS